MFDQSSNGVVRRATQNPGVQIHDVDVDSADAGSAAVLVVVVGATIAGTAAFADEVAPYLTFAGAIIVALIAAVTAGRRQKRSLAAERQRLALQLAHDRELEDAKDLRVFLDGLADTYLKAFIAGSDAVFAVKHAASATNPVEDLANKARARQTDVVSAANRLLLRFPTGHPIAAKYDALRSELHNAEKIVRAANPPDQGASVAAQAGLRAAHHAFAEFSAAARAHVGATQPAASSEQQS